MIGIYVDEAYAFDVLSILYLKRNASLSDGDNYTFLRDCISKQIGNNLFSDIEGSSEYRMLIDLNQSIYLMIDAIRAGDASISAKAVDDANMGRYKAKGALQAKFFSKQLTENKY